MIEQNKQNENKQNENKQPESVDDEIITGEKLDNEIYRFWARKFKCKPEDFDRPGTTLHPNKHLSGSRYVTLYKINERTECAIDRGLVDMMAKGIRAEKQFEPILGKDMQEVFGKDNIKIDSTINYSYLDFEDFSPKTVDRRYTVRQMSMVDSAYLKELKNVCMDRRRTESIVQIDHPVKFGILSLEKLVAISSLVYWGKMIADMAVMTHPQFQENKLGKAIASVVCQWGFDNDKIIQFRYNKNDKKSEDLALALGFKTYVIVDELRVLRKT